MNAVIDIAALLVMPFLLGGIMNRVKAVAAGRRGPPLFQPFHDFLKLLRKGEVVSRTTTLVFKLAPCLSLAAVVAAALFVPLSRGRAFLEFDGDFILFAYFLGLGKFLGLAAALDTGSSFEGMGASRDASFGVLVEPALFLLLGTLAFVTGRGSFADLFRLADGHGTLSLIVLPLAGLALFLLILVEGGRGPVDDPATHLELTMIHEATALDNSGPDLAFIQLARGLKTALYASLIANLVLPFCPGSVLPVVVWLAAPVLVAACAGVIESVLARTRLTHVPQLIFVMTALALIALGSAVFLAGAGAGGAP
ncbi:MAG: NADH-quinone oxidoreductase subunit H [Spirochaetales bacterium]|nr:NADH-quinone oxidoreductase subunit H [Spirochaetales bacterium]